MSVTALRNELARARRIEVGTKPLPTRTDIFTHSLYDHFTRWEAKAYSYSSLDVVKVQKDNARLISSYENASVYAEFQD
jgi:hypothetical protein